MSKVTMKYANSRINGKASEDSHKNLLADMLNELADVLGFNMLLLREDYSEAKGYMIDEEDIDMLAEMVEKAKSSEGKRIRCKDFSQEYADTVDFFITSFLNLAKHNNVPDNTLFEAEYTMHTHTDFVVLKRNVKMNTDKFDADLEERFFAPTDYLPDEDDELTKADKFMFLLYMGLYPHYDVKSMRGIYWCFVEQRQGRNRDRAIRQLHEMSDEEKRKLVDSVWHQHEFESRLDEDDEYIDTIKEFIRIESGQGKLQDKKKVLPLAKKLCEIMDRNADDFMTVEEYAKGEPDFKKSRPAEENIREALTESREVLSEAVNFYDSFKTYRNSHPCVEDDERIIEICYRQRFNENMF